MPSRSEYEASYEEDRDGLNAGKETDRAGSPTERATRDEESVAVQIWQAELKRKGNQPRRNSSIQTFTPAASKRYTRRFVWSSAR